MKPIPRDANSNVVQSVGTECETWRVLNVDSTVGTTITTPEMKSLSIWTDGGEKFAVTGLSNGSQTATIIEPPKLIDNAAATDET